jgi:hypothetical protein
MLGWFWNAWHAPYAAFMFHYTAQSFPGCAEAMGFYIMDTAIEVVFWCDLGLAVRRELRGTPTAGTEEIADHRVCPNPRMQLVVLLWNPSRLTLLIACLPAVIQPALSCKAASLLGLLKLLRLTQLFGTIKDLKLNLKVNWDRADIVSLLIAQMLFVHWVAVLWQ